MKLFIGHRVEHSNSGNKSFDSILATESIFSIRFGNLINLPLVHYIQIVSYEYFYSMHCVTAFVDVLRSIAFNCVDYGVF